MCVGEILVRCVQCEQCGPIGVYRWNKREFDVSKREFHLPIKGAFRQMLAEKNENPWSGMSARASGESKFLSKLRVPTEFPK